MNRRVFILILIKLFSFLILILRIFWLQFVEYKKYNILSQKNRIRILSIPPIRGILKDSRGNIIASNKYCYRVILDKYLINDMEKKLNKLFSILGSNIEVQSAIKKKLINYKGSKPITIFDNINWTELSLIEENSYELEGIYIGTNIVRQYYFIPYLSHIIGYLGFVKTNLPEIKESKEGLMGAEKAFDSYLRGNFGYKEIEVNAHGKFVKDLKIVESQSGEDITLAIDAELQERIYKILPRNNMVVILSETQTGKIKSLISKPSFDNAVFTENITKTSWSQIRNDTNFPLLNRSIQSLYPPGSVFKIVTILAALESGISEHTTYYCSGGPYLGKSFRCWKKHGHGVLDMEGAIEGSCNHYIYFLAEKIGFNQILSMAKKLRLDQLSGIEDLGGEVRSFIPDQEWKQKKYKTSWSFADTLNFCLGQGFVNITPIMLNQLISTVANDGDIIIPSIAQDADSIIIKTNINKEYFTFLKKALFNVVNKPGGTAYRNRITSPNLQMSGKTGTVQVVAKSSKDEDLNKANYARRNHSVFLGYYPSNQPIYAITVFVEHGGAGGSIAAEIAKNCFLITDLLTNK